MAVPESVTSRGPGDSVAAVDRRATLRHSCEVESSCKVPVGRGREPAWPAQIHDVSAGGLGLVTGRWFGEGTLLEIEFNGVSRLCAGSYLVRVRHAAAQANGNWLVGAAFLTPLSDEDVVALR